MIWNGEVVTGAEKVHRSVCIHVRSNVILDQRFPREDARVKARNPKLGLSSNTWYVTPRGILTYSDVLSDILGECDRL
jgi:hypothetical protein